MKNDKGSNKKPKKNEPNPDISEISESPIIEPLPSTSGSTNSSDPNAINQQPENVPYTSNTCSSKNLEGNIPKTHVSGEIKNAENKETPPFVKCTTCTVKDMLDEILDCTVVRRPSILQGPTTPQTDRSQTEPVLNSGIPECVLDPRLIPRQILNARYSRDDNTCSRMQYTIKEVLNEILEYSIFKKSVQQASSHASTVNDLIVPGTSHARPDYLSQGELDRPPTGYEIYKALAAGLIQSTSALQSPSTKILPSYSAVLRLGPPRMPSFISSTGSFIPKLPPPSYAEVEGIWEENPSLISSESVIFGPDPTYMVCPRCRAVVVTDTQTERSNVSHVVAIIMCLFLCWPCCLLPYCLRSCSYTYHTCPNCSHYFGMYRPF